MKKKLVRRNKNKHLADEDLVRIIVLKNSHEEFGVLYDRYAQRVYHKCLSFASDTDVAQDLMHDVFLKAFINLSKFKHQSKFSTWLYSLTYTFCVDYVRKTQKMKKSGEDELTNLPEINEEKDERELLAIKSERLKNVLDNIPPEDKMILLMKYQDDLSIKELMAVFEIKESAIKMKLSRARAKAINQHKKMYTNG